MVLDEDEKLSPSFENAIILWTLEKIDPRLPQKVKRDYGHQMTGNITLKDIQPVIFENINTMIDDLDQNSTIKAFAFQTNDEETNINAINTFRGSWRGKTRPFPFKARASNRGYAAIKTRGTDRSLKSGNNLSDKYCRICHLAGSDLRIYSSHEIGTCNRLLIRDLESIKNALVLNGMITVDDEHLEEPCCVLQPGWDDLERSDPQNDDQD